jgi:hypothetical protein
LDRVHANYAKQSAIEAKAAADLALSKIGEVATAAAVASAKADGAKDMAKSANRFVFDPMLACCFIAVLIFVVLALITRVEVKQGGDEKQKQQTSLPTPAAKPMYRCDINANNATAKNCVRTNE